MTMSQMKSCTLLVTLGLLGCVQAVPVIKEHADNVEQAHDIFQSPNVNANSINGISIHHNNNIDKANENKNVNADHSIENQSGSESLSQPFLLSQKGQGQSIDTPLPLLDSMVPLAKTTGSDNGHPTEISKEFTKKVLQAFFSELKNRPDLVDEILRRETYKLLMSIAQEDSEFSNAIPPEVELTQELVPVPALRSLGPIETTDPENPTTVLNKDQNIPEGKATEENHKAGVLKTVSNIPSGEGSPGSSEASKLQSALAKELDKIDPYYYYVYYDENETPNSSSSNNKEEEEEEEEDDDEEGTPQHPPGAATTNINDDGTQSANTKIDVTNNKPTIAVTDMKSKPQNVPSGPSVTAEDKTDDFVTNKIALAMRSAIARDMEEQLARSRLANDATDKEESRFDVKLPPLGNKVAQSKQQSSDQEEIELTNLSQ